MFRDKSDRIWTLEYANDLVPLTQMRFNIYFQNGRYLIERAPAPKPDEDTHRAVHEGSDPRAYMGTDPALRLALRQFVERERAGS
jgi:hypothetical protein